MKHPFENRVVIGQPTKPDQKLAHSVADAIASFPEVQTAHLPLVQRLDTSDKPALVLFVVLDPFCSQAGVLEQIKPRLSRCAVPGGFLDVIPMKPDDPFLYWVEKARSRILSRSPTGEPILERPWTRWKLLLERLTRNFK